MIHLLLAVIYAAFISLGLPDSLLGAAWPSMYQGFGVPVSYSGIIFCIVSGGTVISSLLSDRLTRRLGAGPGDGHQRGHDRSGPFRIFDQRAVLDAVPVGGALWPGRRKRGCRPSITMWPSISPAAI